MFNIASALAEAGKPKYGIEDRINIVKSIESMLQAIPVVENLDVSEIAPILHSLFATYTPLRGAVVSLCSCLESIAPESITEKYLFDYLICILIEQRSYSETPSGKETERREIWMIVFRYIAILLKFRRQIPTSVLRALVALYDSSKGTENEKYIGSVVGFLCEAVLYCKNIERVPEICQILVTELLKKGNATITKLIAYTLEEGIPLVRDTKALWPLLAPLSQLRYINDQTKNDEDITSGARTALTLLLQTWPGTLCFGIQGGAINDLVRCLSKETDVVISILRNVMKLESPFQAITDPFTGLFLYVLLKEGLIQKLNQISAKPPATSFLNDILPYTTHTGLFGVDLTKHALQAPIVATPHVPNSMLFDLSQTVKSTQMVSIAAVEKMTQLEYAKWDWMALLMLFTVILPHNDQEANNSQAREIYSRVFAYISGPFLKITPGKCSSVTEAFYAMLQLLMTRKKWGKEIMKNSTCLADTLISVLEGLEKGVIYEQNSPQWAVFKCIGMLMGYEDGPLILTCMKDKNKSVLDRLTDICRTCNNEKLCALILDVCSFDAYAQNTLPFVHHILVSPSIKVHRTVIADLRKKYLMTKGATRVIFNVLVTHMKTVWDKPDEKERLVLEMNFMAELLLSDPSVLDLMFVDRTHPTPPTILRANDHFILALAMPNEKILKEAWIDDEINWWMTTGNRTYVDLYDKAVSCAFSGNLDVAQTKEPSILNANGSTVCPPHLFGKLSQNKPGLAKIVSRIPELIAQLESRTSDKNTLRAALFALGHFGSSPLSDPFIEQYEIPLKMIKSVENHSSYVLKGTLIAALSLFKQSRYLSSVLLSHNWQLFRYGSHQAVIPSDPAAWLGEMKPTPVEYPAIPTIPKYSKVINHVKLLGNALQSKTATDALREMKTSNDRILKESELAAYCHKLMSEYFFEPISRKAINSLFGGTPLMPCKPLNVEQDTADSALISAKITSVMAESRNRFAREDLTITNAKIPLLTLQQLKEFKPRPRCPEVFISETDLKTVGNCTLDEFYHKSGEEQAAIREKILEK